MSVPVHSLIKQQREQLGITESELARRIGVSEGEYRDLESYDDELVMVLPLKNARLLAGALGFDLATLLVAGSQRGGSNATAGPRNVVLADARNSLGVSMSKMADDIGFEEVFVQNIEESDYALECFPYEVVKIVAKYLKLDPIDLLNEPSAQM